MYKCFDGPMILSYDYVSQYLAAFIVSVGLLVEGMHYGWSSSAVPKLLESNLPITSEQVIYITQMFTYGSITYDILSISDYPRINQKVGVISSVAIMTLSWLLIAFSKTAISFMIARFFAGAARGLAYQISVSYICEIASPEIRGVLSSLTIIMNNLGMLLIYSFGPYLNIYFSALIGVGISLIELIAVKWVPESPYILLITGKTRKARNAFRSLRNLWNVEEELDTVLEVVKKQDDENSSILSIFTVQSNRKALFIILGLNALQSLVGINISTHQILKLAGGNIESYRVAVVSSFISVISCTLTALFVDYVGRKAILIISFMGSGFSFGLLGYYSYYTIIHPHHSINILPIACLMCYTMVYRMGIGLIPLLLSGELFPMNTKNISSTITGLLSILFNFLTIWLMDITKRRFGQHVMYWVCGVNCIIGVGFTWLFVPETKRLSLDQIQTKLKNGKV